MAGGSPEHHVDRLGHCVGDCAGRFALASGREVTKVPAHIPVRLARRRHICIHCLSASSALNALRASARKPPDEFQHRPALSDGLPRLEPMTIGAARHVKGELTAGAMNDHYFRFL